MLDSTSVTYKDSTRGYWTIDLDDTGDVVVDETGDIHTVWRYTISRMDHGEPEREVHTDCMTGQYDIRLTLKEILLDFMTHMQSAVMDIIANTNGAKGDT